MNAILNSDPHCTDCGMEILTTSQRRYRVPPTTALTPGFLITPTTKDRAGDVKLVAATLVCRPCFKKVAVAS